MAPAPLLYLLPQHPLLLKPPAPGIMWAHYTSIWYPDQSNPDFDWYIFPGQQLMWPQSTAPDQTSQEEPFPEIFPSSIGRKEVGSFGVDHFNQIFFTIDSHYLSGRSRIAMAHEMLICATSLARHFHHIPVSKVRSMHCWLTQIWFQDIFTSHVRCNPNWADGTNDGVKR